MNLFFFALFGLLSALAAMSVLWQKRAVYSALSLVLCLGSLAAIYLQLAAPFAAAMQMIIYAGAIMVLFIFVIMLLDPQSDEASGRLRPFSLLALVMGFSFLTLLWVFLRNSQSIHGVLRQLAVEEVPSAGAKAVGRVLFQHYLIPLQAVGILILMATMGAVLLAGKKR